MSETRTDMHAGKLGVLILLALAIGVGGGWWPTLVLAGSAGVRGMLVAASISLFGLAAGLAILARRAQAGRGKLAMTFLMTAPVRMFVTLGGATLAWWIGRLDPAPLLVWVGIFYLLLLAAEVGWLFRLVMVDR